MSNWGILLRPLKCRQARAMYPYFQHHALSTLPSTDGWTSYSKHKPPLHQHDQIVLIVTSDTHTSMLDKDTKGTWAKIAC